MTFRDRLSTPGELLPPLATTEGGWTLEVRWHPDHWTDGPYSAVVRLADDAPEDVRERGLTTGVLRRLEGRLTELVQEHHGAGDQDAYVSAVQALEGIGPRDRPEDYYRLLLDAYFTGRRLHPADATKRLSEHLKVPRGTIATRLDVAKRRHPELVEADRQLGTEQ